MVHHVRVIGGVFERPLTARPPDGENHPQWTLSEGMVWGERVGGHGGAYARTVRNPWEGP